MLEAYAIDYLLLASFLCLFVDFVYFVYVFLIISYHVP